MFSLIALICYEIDQLVSEYKKQKFKRQKFNKQKFRKNDKRLMNEYVLNEKEKGKEVWNPSFV